MKRVRAHISGLYVLSVALVAIGHCWPVAHASAAPADTVQYHDHKHTAGHEHHGQAEKASVNGCIGDEVVCALDESAPALTPASVSGPDHPSSKSFALLPAIEAAFPAPAGAFTSRGPPERRTHSLHSYAEAFARTGRLLI